jgi:DNA-binding PadR family transcriptional regulator
MKTPQLAAKNGRRAFRARRGETALAVLSVLASGRAALTPGTIAKRIRELSRAEWAVTTSSVNAQLDDLLRSKLVFKQYRDDPLSGSDYYYSIEQSGLNRLTASKTELDALWSNFKDVPSDGSQLELELEKLQQALTVVDKLSDERRDKITTAVADLRKTIYTVLAED